MRHCFPKELGRKRQLSTNIPAAAELACFRLSDSGDKAKKRTAADELATLEGHYALTLNSESLNNVLDEIVARKENLWHRGEFCSLPSCTIQNTATSVNKFCLL